MPELPEVETIKEALKKAITDVKIISVEVRNRRFRQLIPDDFESIVSNSDVINVWRKAKYAIIDLDNRYSIIWHFGMSGKVKIIDKHLDEYEKHDHVIFNTSNGEIIFNDAVFRIFSMENGEIKKIEVVTKKKSK